jgi:hypothetical protein
VNEVGLRGPAWPQDPQPYKIVTVGGSTFFDDFHFTEVGSRRVATVIAGFLNEYLQSEPATLRGPESLPTHLPTNAATQLSSGMGRRRNLDQACSCIFVDGTAAFF